ncbi:MAG TPA: hypothetical protein VLE23_19875 [Geminicoccaceae bacterium]|nr:hypothetical protein [Geminicoccaceae bacterium]
MAAPNRPFLDRPVARYLALLVLLACLAALGWLERERWLPSQTTAATDPAALCFAQRAAEIDRMLAEELIAAQQAGAFKSRAEAMCRATAEGAAPGPALPQ